MWQYRELIRNLTIADLKNRYQNTSFGFLWSILSPLLLALVLWFVFRTLFQQEENYAANLIVGIMTFRFFSIGTTQCLVSIISRPSLVTKVYIPRQILVLSNALSSLIGSLLEFLVLVPIIFFVLGNLPVTIVLFPVIHLLFFFLVLGIGLFLSSLYVYFRDLNQIWEVLLNILFFASPVVYPVSIVPERLITYYMVNPLTRLIVIYRESMVGGKLPDIVHFAVVIGFSALAFFVGSYIFGKLQRRFAEEI